MDNDEVAEEEDAAEEDDDVEVGSTGRVRVEPGPSFTPISSGIPALVLSTVEDKSTLSTDIKCSDYVKAWKRLTVHQAPNILTIALKRFQSGRFGKLNKRVTFPEMLDLGPYMSESGNGTDLYRLYAVVVHVDMLNASFFGHYICYTQDFCGNWYRIDDCKVMKVELEEVLAQGAYMLLYSRLHVRQPCLKPFGPSMGEKERLLEVQVGSQGSSNMSEQYGNAQSGSSLTRPGDLSSDISLQSSAESADMDLVHSTEVGPDPIIEDQEDVGLDISQAGPSDPACSDSVGLVHLSNGAEKDPSIEIIHRESIDSDFLIKQSLAVRSNTTLSQENDISSSADCNDEEVNDTISNHSNVLCSSESPSDDTFPRNSSTTSAPNANLDNASTFAEEANGVLMHNRSSSTTGTTRSGKAFRAIDAVRDKATSSCRRKPLFTPGFLDKPTRKKAAPKDDKAQSQPEDLGGTQVVSSGSQFCEPVLSHLDDHKVDVHEDVHLDSLPANGMGLLNLKELVMPQSPNGDKNWSSNGGTVRISPTSNTECNGTSSVENVHIHDLWSATPSGNGRDDSLDFRNSEVLVGRSEFLVGKLEASCNGFLDKSISSQNGSNGCERDKRSLTICEKDSISDMSLCNELLGAEVAKQPEGISRDVPYPETDSGRVADSLPDGAGPYGLGPCWENSKDTNLNCKRPRQERD
ncbi:hypothetical protein ACLOJK_030591 [Asimina triloba]